MDPYRIGIAIKTLRLKAGYTQHDIADCLNVTDKAVSKWERGLSIPDVSIITKLSLLLNCDVDNLLEGNITYLEDTWQGLLILRNSGGIYAGSEVYGKPLVYLYLSYFMLAGISQIYISCTERDCVYISERLGTGENYGISLTFLPDGKVLPPIEKNTMVIYRNPFLYGANLTKYFQRAMSRQNGISFLTVPKKADKDDEIVSFDKHRCIKMHKNSGTSQVCLPVAFFPKKYFELIPQHKDITQLKSVFAEPAGNGFVAYSIMDLETLWETSSFLRFLSKRMGMNVYDLEEVARNRKFIE